MKVEHLDTSDVGSMPIEYSLENLRRVARDKVDIGLDYPSYTQFSDLDMNMEFLLPIEELGGGVKVDRARGKASLVDENLEVEGFVPPIAKEFSSYFKEGGLDKRAKGKRAPVTGPFTLATKIGPDLMRSAASRQEAVSSLARTLKEVCKLLTGEQSYEMVCIDEPMLSVILSRKRILFNYDLEFISSTLNEVLEGIEGISMVHICGRLPPMVKELLFNTSAQVLDHEFADYPKNFGFYHREELEAQGRFIGLGCVSSVNPEVESVETIGERIRRGIESFGERLLLDPDCGMGSLSGENAYYSAIQKLENMVRAAEGART